MYSYIFYDVILNFKKKYKFLIDLSLKSRPPKPKITSESTSRITRGAFLETNITLKVELPTLGKCYKSIKCPEGRKGPKSPKSLTKSQIEKLFGKYLFEDKEYQIII